MASGGPPLHRHARQRGASTGGSAGAGAGPAGVHRGGGEEAPGRAGHAPAARQVQVQRPRLRSRRRQAAAGQVPQLPVLPGGGQEGSDDGDEARPGRRRPLAGHQDHTDQGQGPARQRQRRHQAEVVQVPGQEDVRLQWRLLGGAASELEGPSRIKDGEGRRVRLTGGRHNEAS